MSNYFFIHIPKTAGTSFRKMLYREFRGKRIYPTRGELRRNDGRYVGAQDLPSIDKQRRSKTEMFVGHYPFGLAERFFDGGDVVHLTFVREAVPRAVSNLLHLQRRSLHLQGESFEEIFHRANPAISNSQTRFLSGQGAPATSAHLELAKANLAQFAFVGLTERFGESIQLANAEFGWSLGDSLDLNRTDTTSQQAVPPELLARIEEANGLDHELYEFALTLFEEKVAGLTP